MRDLYITLGVAIVAFLIAFFGEQHPRKSIKIITTIIAIFILAGTSVYLAIMALAFVIAYNGQKSPRRKNRIWATILAIAIAGINVTISFYGQNIEDIFKCFVYLIAIGVVLSAAYMGLLYGARH